MDQNTQTPDERVRERRLGCLPVIGLLLAAAVVTAILTVWAVKANLFPSEFQPVALDTKEEKVLEGKLEKLESLDAHQRAEEVDPNAPLEPDAYSEEGASRRITFTEKELNALLAKNSDLARKLAVDLSERLVSAKLLVPVDEDFPILGGQVLRVKAGLGLAYENGQPVITIRGVTVMGVPIPNAWLGGLKDIDLVKEFGGEAGFWKSLAAGIENIRVEQGKLLIELKE